MIVKNKKLMIIMKEEKCLNIFKNAEKFLIKLNISKI